MRPPVTRSRTATVLAALLIPALIVLVLASGLGHRALWSPDEGRYTEIPLEMMAAGDYVTPRLNGVKYFEKPPLFYWAQTVPLRLFGVSEWSARLVTLISAIGGCFVTWAMGRRLFGGRAGASAAVVLATTPLWFFMGRVITLDMTLSFLLTAGLAAFLVALREPPDSTNRTKYLMIFYAACAGAVMTKGLVGIVLPALIIGAWMVVTNSWRELRHLRLGTGIAVLLALTAPWHILVARANPEFLDFYFIHEHLQRYTTTVHARVQPAWYFVAVAFLGMIPWTAFIFQAVRALGPLRVLRHQRENVFLILWALTPIAFFSLSQSKLIPYILPSFPPLALLIGRYLSDPPAPTFRPRAPWALVAICLVPVAMLFYVPMYLEGRELDDRVARLGMLPWASGALLAITAMAGAWFMGRRPRLALWVVAAGMASWLHTMDRAASTLDAEKSTKDFAAILRTQAHPGDEIAHYGDYFQDLPVYLHREMPGYHGGRITIAGWNGELTAGTRWEDVSAWMIADEELARRWRGDRTVFLVTRLDRLAPIEAMGPVYRMASSGERVLVTNQSRSGGAPSIPPDARPFATPSTN